MFVNLVFKNSKNVSPKGQSFQNALLRSYVEKLFDTCRIFEICYILFIYFHFQAAFSALLAVSVLYIEKKSI